MGLDRLMAAADLISGYAKINEQRARIGKTDETVLKATTERMTAAWSLLGVSVGKDLSATDEEPVSGLNAPHDGLAPPPPDKVKPLPTPPSSFNARFGYFGFHYPTPNKSETLAMPGDGAPYQSILPWTPHPQHGSFSNRRMRNRTGVSKRDYIPRFADLGVN